MLAKRMTRPLAYLLTLAMLLGLLPVSALAAHDLTGGQGAYVDLSTQDEATSSGYAEVEDHLITVQDGSGKDALWADKTMEPVKGEADTYDITLMTQTTKEIQEIVTSPNTAVVLVFDVSGSMTQNSNKLYYTNPDGSKDWVTRLEAARRAANVFLDDYVDSAAEASNDVQRMIAVTAFANKATQNLGWTDVANGAGNASDPNSAKGVITKIANKDGNGGTGTDISKGLEKAASLLEDSKVKDYTHKYVILLTDGAPSKDSSIAPTESAAAGLKADDVTIFTIAFDISDKIDRSYRFQGIMECKESGGHYHSRKEVNSYGYEGGSYVILTGYYFSGPHSGTKVVDEIQSETISVNSWLQDHIATPTSSDGTKYYYTADDADQLKLAFGGILTTISKLSKAWTIEDPIGRFFTFQGLVTSKGLVSDKGGMAAHHVTRSDDGKLTWAVLDSTYTKRDDISTEPGTTVWKYTYELTYRVKLDAAAEGLETGKHYPANGRTTLYYTVDDDGNLGLGDTKPQDLYVPTAWGTVPDATYTIEFYKKDRTSGEFVLQEDDSLPGTGKLWETVSLWPEGEPTPAEYADKYASPEDGYYQLTSGDRTARLESTIGTVLKFCYDPTPVDVRVEHYVTTIQKTDDGEVTDGPNYFGESAPQDTEYYKGDVFSADDPNLLLDLPIDPKHTDPADYHNVTLDQDENVIKVYYIQELEDGRTPVEYTINYFYRTSEWAVSKDTGLITEVWPDYPGTPDPTVSGTYQGFHNESVQAPLTGKETHDGHYELDETETGETSMTLDKKADKNVLNIYLQHSAEEPPSDASLQIKHVYQRIVLGGGTELDGVDYEYEEGGIPVHIGETHGTDPKMTFTADDGSTYTYTEYTTDQPEGALTKVMEAGYNEIVVTYLRDARVKTDVTVEHYFYQKEWEIDADGDAQIVTPDEPTAIETQELEGPFYVGGSATATSWPLTGDYAGYALDDPDDLTLTDLKENGNVIKLYYYRDPLTDLDGADVTVTHTYNTYTTYINDDGATVENEPSTNSKREDKVEGYVGEWFEAHPDFSDKNGDSEGYYQISPTKNGTGPEKVTLTTTGGEFPFTYERYLDLRVETDYTVQPILVTYSRSIDPDTGETVVAETGREDGAPWTSADQPELTVYAGQKISVDPSRFDPDQGGVGFEFDSADSETTEDYEGYRLSEDAGSNVIYLVYAKTVDDRGEPVDVVVRNHYTFDTFVYENGEPTTHTTKNIDTSSPVSMYLGQFFDTTGKGRPMADYEAQDPIPAQMVQITQDGLEQGVFYVDFYWYGSKDKTDEQKATVQVIHHYTEIDRDGDKGDREWTVGDRDEDIKSGFYATETYVASYDFQNGLFSADSVTEVDPDGATEQDVGVTLVPGLNQIHIYYERYYHSKVNTNVEITHDYYAMDTFQFGDMSPAEYLAYAKEQGIDAEYSKLVTVSGRDNGAYVGGSFTADRVLSVTVNEGTPEEKTYTYTEAGADPEGGVIDSLLAATENEPKPNRITIRYVRQFDSRTATSVTVEHKYFTEDTYTGSRVEDAGLYETVTESTFEQGVWVGNEYTAKELVKSGYDRETPDAGMVIASLAPGGNTITVSYVRHISTDPGNYTVNVRHVDGSEGAPQQAALSAFDSLNNTFKVGASYTAQPVPAETLAALDYKQAGQPAVEGEAVRNGVVNVTYTYVPKAEVSLTVNYVAVEYDSEGVLHTVKTLETAAASHKEGYQYDLPAKDFAGYAYLGLAEGSAPAAGTLVLGQDVTVTFQYTAESFPFRVDYYNDHTGTFLETYWHSDMTAPFGKTLTNSDVAPFFDPEGNVDWQALHLPSGYHIARVEYPTIAVSPEAQPVETPEGEEAKFDPSPITNIVEVHYGYRPSGGGDDRPDPSERYTIRIEYLEKDTGDELADAYTVTMNDGRHYDVGSAARKRIEGYAIDSVDGEISGILKRDVDITVWYVAETDITDERPPQGDTPDPEPSTPGTTPDGGSGTGDDLVDIGDGDTPLGGLPEGGSGLTGGEGTDGGDTVIIDDRPPMGDLPQTGTLAQPTDPTRTLGMMALALSMAAAGLMITIGRKREDEEA